MGMTELMILSVIMVCGGGATKNDQLCKLRVINCIQNSSAVQKQATIEKCAVKAIERKSGIAELLKK
jgi:hypothetical protein